MCNWEAEDVLWTNHRGPQCKIFILAHGIKVFQLRRTDCLEMTFFKRSFIEANGNCFKFGDTIYEASRVRIALEYFKDHNFIVYVVQNPWSLKWLCVYKKLQGLAS